MDETAINPSEAFIPKVANWAPFVLAGTKVRSYTAALSLSALLFIPCASRISQSFSRHAPLVSACCSCHFTQVVSGYAEILVCAVGKRTLWMATMDTVVVNDGLTPHFAKQRAVVQLRR